MESLVLPNQNLFFNFLKITLGILLLTVIFVLFKPSHVFADTASCGIHTGNVDDYEGLVVDLQYIPAGGGAPQDARGVQAEITTVTSPDGDGEIYNNGTNQSTITLSQINTGSEGFCHPGYSNYQNQWMVIMGYGSYQSDPGVYLDCDHSVQKYYTSGPMKGQLELSQYDVTGVGVPNGQPSGGWWSTAGPIGGPNGTTAYATVTYHDPAPKYISMDCYPDYGGYGYLSSVQVNTSYSFQMQLSNDGNATADFLNPSEPASDVPNGDIGDRFQYRVEVPSGTWSAWQSVSIDNGPGDGGSPQGHIIGAGQTAVLDLNNYTPTQVGDYVFEYEDTQSGTTNGGDTPCYLDMPVYSPQSFVCSNPTTYPTNTTVNSTSTITLSVQNSGTETTYFDPSNTGGLPQTTFQYNILYPGGGSSGITSLPIANPDGIGPNSPDGSVATGSFSFTPTLDGTYTIQYNTSSYWGGGSPCSISITVSPIYKPFFRVNGGNVQAGIGYGISGCSSNSTAGITGYDQQSGSTYYGASGQDAAIATGTVSGYASGENPDWSAVNVLFSGSPNYLTFSNNGTAGNIGSTFPSCVQDYDSYVSTTGDHSIASDTSVTGLSGVYLYNSGAPGLTLYGGNINPSTKVFIVVKDANVYITNGNISYNSYTVSTVPTFELIDYGGDIYVDKGVTGLEGTYIAEPDPNNGNSGGYFITCASAISVSDKNYNDCDSQLNITGAVSANHLELLRTYGDSQAGSSSTPAETFNYSPEVWLPETGIPPQNTPPEQSLISLPPVL